MMRLDTTAGLVNRAITLKDQYGIQYYDALIVAAAERLSCDCIYSEDMSDCAAYGKVRIVNPFQEI